VRAADLRAARRGRDVNRRAALGDFLGAAHHQLGTAAVFRTAIARGGDMTEIRHSLLRVVLAMSRHVQDVTATGPQHRRGHPVLEDWDRAGMEAREALIHAAAALHGDTIGARQPGVAAGSELARRLDAAALSLTYGRDLLHTHLARGPRGGLRFHSEWGSVLITPRARWALLAEMGSFARRLAPLGEQVGYSARARGSPRARQALNGACHWLEIMSTSIRQAHLARPVSAAELELLRAIPAGACLPWLRPDTSAPVRSLPETVVATAERARHAAWLSDSQPPWRPGMSVNSLRQTAAASTLTSHHCEILLRSLARGQRMGGEPAIALRAAADAAGRMRTRWLAIAHALDQVTTSSQDQPTPFTAAAGDLALWTGRLAHADPGWTLASGPGPAPRPGEEPSREPNEMRESLAAVHDACDAMSWTASADRRRVRALAAAGQVLVAAGPEPGTLDMLGPLAPARPDRIGALLTLYQYTTQASAEVTTTVSVAASAARVPHRTVLPAGHRREPVTPEAAEQIADAQSLYQPGRIERTLRGLGVTDIDLLRRGGEIDRAAEQLIIQAAERESRLPEPSGRGLRVQAVKRDHRQRASTDGRTGLAAGTSMSAYAEGAEAEP
jgi:hypothetical protein